MGLDVGLVIDIEAERVAEFIEFPRLGIMAGADGVDIGPAHQQQVLQDVLPGQIMAGPGVVLMEIDALELDRLSIDQQGLDLAIAILDLRDLDPAETDMEAGVFPIDLQEQGIELRRLGRPLPHIRNDIRDGRHLAGEFETGVRDRPPVLVDELIEDVCRSIRTHLHPENAVLAFFVQGRYDAEIKAAGGLLAREVHIPFDAGNPPEILALQIGAGRVTQNFQQQLILSLFHCIRDVIAGERLGVLPVADLPAVDIDIGAGLDPAEVQEDAAALPALRHGKRPVVQRPRKHFRQLRRLRIHRAEIVRMVDIDGRPPALDLPVARDADAVPGDLCARSRNPVMVFVILEIPDSVETQVVLALSESLGEGIVPVGEVDDFRPPGFGVDARYLGVFPVRKLLGFEQGRRHRNGSKECGQFLYHILQRYDFILICRNCPLDDLSGHVFRPFPARAKPGAGMVSPLHKIITVLCSPRTPDGRQDELFFIGNT